MADTTMEILTDNLRDEITKLRQKIKDLEMLLAEAEEEADDLRSEWDQEALASQYAQLVAMLDDYFGVRFFPLAVQMAISEVGRAVGAYHLGIRSW